MSFGRLLLAGITAAQVSVAAASMHAGYATTTSPGSPPQPPLKPYGIALEQGEVIPLAEDIVLGRTTTATPQFGLTEDGRMVYQAYSNNNWDIYIADPSGAGSTRLTNSGANEVRPRLNLALSRIVFASDRTGNYEVFSMDLNGGDVRQITGVSGTDTMPEWSPDGSKIVFASNRQGAYRIYTMNADGSAQTAITSSSSNDVYPTWSSDGQHIAYVAFAGNIGTLNVVTPNGTPVVSFASGISARYMSQPMWAPDTHQLAFDGDVTGDGLNELVIASDDAGPRILVLGNANALTEAWMGSWSPDSQELAFGSVTYRIDGNSLVVRQVSLHRIHRSGASLRSVSSPEGIAALQNWQAIDTQPPSSRVLELPAAAKIDAIDLTWQGSDVGATGVADYDVQYRSAAVGVWVNWLQRTRQTSARFPSDMAMAGSRMSFRVRARDGHNNVEPWPTAADGDTGTEAFGWLLSGRITDNRGYFVPGANVHVNNTSPATVTTGIDGLFMSQRNTSGETTLRVVKAGYGPSEVLPASQCCDWPPPDLFVSTLPLNPVSTVINNGTFAAAGTLEGWTTEQTTEVTATITQYSPSIVVSPNLWPYERAAAFSSGCTDPCLSKPISTTRRFITANLAGHRHGVADIGISYVRLLADGSWSPPEFPVSSLEPISTVQIVFDGQDRLRVFYRLGNGLDTYQTIRRSDGTWSAGQIVTTRAATDQFAAFSSTGNGRVDAVYCSEGMQLMRLTGADDGTFQAPQLVGPYCGSGVDIDTQGAVHLVTFDAPQFTYRAFAANGVELRSEIVGADANGYSGALTRLVSVDGLGRVHILLSNGFDGIYRMRSVTGVWSESQLLPSVNHNASLLADTAGNVHILGRPLYSFSPSLYYFRPTNGPFAPLIQLQNGAYDPAYLSLDLADRAHLTYFSTYPVPGESEAGWKYQSTVDPGSIARPRLSQTLSIPADWHHPTLSFSYRLSGVAPGGNAGFSIYLQNAQTTRRIFFTHAPTSLTHAWADLGPEAGNQITLTFVLEQPISAAVSDGISALILDNVAVGDWRSPAISALSKTQLAETNIAQSIILTGNNFLPETLVQLDGSLTLATTWRDENTLEVQIPGGIKPGFHHLTLVNPDGRATGMPNAIQIGINTYLPMVRRTS